MRDEVPSLTGLRFVAAFCVAFAHSNVVLMRIENLPSLRWLDVPAGFGMTLFFVLSGFVIHYNYRRVTGEGVSGVGRFLWARFSRLYPLFLFVLLLDVIFGRQLYSYVTGTNRAFLTTLSALPYYLTFTQGWFYSLFESSSLIYVTGANSSLTWSISVEWFFYLSFPFVAVLITRIRSPYVVLAVIFGWSAIWATLASNLDGHTNEIDAWASNYFGAVAGLQLGYQDSFVRWINYFSPYLRIGEFVLGCLLSQLYIFDKDRPVGRTERRLGLSLLALGIISIPTISYLTYSSASPFLHSLRSNYALAPSVALIIFTSARYPSPVAQLLNSRPFVALGEASYSIYMLHFLIITAVASATGQVIPLAFWPVIYAIVRFICSVALVMLVALGSYTFLEVPSRKFLRQLLPANATPRQTKLAVGLLICPAIAALLFITVSHLALRSDDFLPAGGLKIISATYGANCGAKAGNASLSVRNACHGKADCEYTVDVNLLGDPAGGCAKSFFAEYVCDSGDRRTSEVPAEAGFGGRLLLTCPPKKISSSGK